MKSLVIVLLLGIGSFSATAQAEIAFIPATGMTFPVNSRYERCAGHVNPAFLFSLSFLYHPSPWVSLEVSYLNHSPVTYLNSPDESSVRAYTTAKIKDEKLLGGINFTVPAGRVKPYLGVLAGLTYASTQDPLNMGTLTRFAWSLQSGLDFGVSSFLSIHYRIAFIQTQNVPDNSAYFNVGKNGEGFPSFALGEPSTADITQLNMAVGLNFHFAPGTRARNQPAANPAQNK